MTPASHLKHEVAVGGISNAVFNGLIAWAILRSGPALAWQGDSSFAVDIVATAFILPLIVTLIVIPLQRKKLASGALHPLRLAGNSFMQFIADKLPGRTFPCALTFGLIGALVIAPITLLGFYLLGVNSVTPAQYALFKGIWAGGMAAILVVPMVLVALREPPGNTTAEQTTD